MPTAPARMLSTNTLMRGSLWNALIACAVGLRLSGYNSAISLLSTNTLVRGSVWNALTACAFRHVMFRGLHTVGIRV